MLKCQTVKKRIEIRAQQKEQHRADGGKEGESGVWPMKQHIFWHLLQKFRSHSEGCNTPRKMCYNNFWCLRPKSKSIVRVCVCCGYEGKRGSVYMCVTATRIEICYFCFISKFIMQKPHKFRAQTFSFFKKKKDELRMVVWARGTGLAKRFIVHCPYVSGYKSAITSQAAHEFRLTFCVANLTGKLRTLMNCFCMDAYCIH